MKGEKLKSTLFWSVLGASLLAGTQLRAQSTNLLISLDASTLTEGSNWANSGTLGGEFTPSGNIVLETIGGMKAVTFPGSGDAFVGPLAPDNLLGNHARSIEVWVYNPEIADEETMVAWGMPGNVAAANFAFNYGLSDTVGAARQGDNSLGWGTPVPEASAWHCLVYTFDGAKAAVYDNGGLSRQTNAVLDTASANINVGAQNDFFGMPQVAFSGSLSIAKVKIFDVALSASQVSSNFSQAIGALKSISLQIDTNMLVGGKQQAAVFGSYANFSDLEITSLPAGAYTSGNTNVLTVSSSGALYAVAEGTTTLKVQYQGLQATQTVTVAARPPATLKYRYSFNDAAFSDTAAESVSGAKGTVIGTTEFADGVVGFAGIDGYVNLPNGIISGLKNASFDLWVAWSGDGQANEPIFDFGNNTSGEDSQGDATTHIWLTPMDSDGKLNFSTSDGVTVESLRAPALEAGVLTHVTVVYSYGTLEQKLYVNGVLADSQPLSIALSSLADVNNWLGRSQVATYPYFNGQIAEFRIYDGALTADEVFLSQAAGTEQVGSSAGNLKNLAVSFPANSLWLGALQPVKVTANYDSVTNLDITGWSGLTYQSSDASIASVSASGVVEALAVGNATITALYQVYKASNTVAVIAVPGVPATPQAIHRYSFSETNGATTVADSIGSAPGTLNEAGTPAFDSGKLTLNGAAVGLPGSLISGLTNVTLEAWVTWQGGAQDGQQLFDFGGGDPLTYFGVSARRAGSKTLGFSLAANDGTELTLDAATALATNQAAHVVLAYNYAAGTARLYVNGTRVGLLTGIPALSTLTDSGALLGAAINPDGTGFNGALDEFRIYNGALSEAEVAENFAAGPDLLPGESATPPVLKIAKSGASVILTWVQTGNGFSLQTTSKLGTGATWQAVTFNPVAVGQTNRLTNAIGAGSLFYRLKK